MPRLVTFSSDYGPTDEFVGVCHLVIARMAPEVRVVDVVHGLRGVRDGSAVVARSLAEAPAGAVHLVVVDPGVGTGRRALAIACRDGSLLVGPDNGVLHPATDVRGGVAAAWEITATPWLERSPSPTFHGRDIFAPAAAYLALERPPEELGPPVDPGGLVRLAPPLVRVAPGSIEGEVLRVDWFGNVELWATEADFRAAGLVGEVLVDGRPAKVGRTFSDVGPGELLVYVDSGGRVAVARRGGRADELLGHPSWLTIVQAGGGARLTHRT